MGRVTSDVAEKVSVDMQAGAAQEAVDSAHTESVSMQEGEGQGAANTPNPSGKMKGFGGASAPIIGATALLAAKYPSFISGENDSRSKSESRVVFFITAVIVAFLMYSWSKWGNINFQRGSNFHYNMGLVGGILMLMAMLYSLRKRLKILRRVGKIENWYYFHLIGGVIGPIIIVFHSSFNLKSINSSMAFIAMVLVAVSGLFGRYIYTRIGYGLHRKLLAIKNTEKALIKSIRGYESELVEVIERRLSTFAISCLSGPKSIIRLPMRFVVIKTIAAKAYVTISEDMTRMMRLVAQYEGWSAKEYEHVLAEEKRFLRQHINSVVEIAHVHLYERLLVRWRVLHVPLLFFLVISALFHVLAVHMY